MAILGYFKKGTDVYENTGAGTSRKLELPEFKSLGINYDFLGEGLMMTKPLAELASNSIVPVAPIVTPTITPAPAPVVPPVEQLPVPANMNLSKVATGSVGPDGKPIYDVFSGTEHIKDPTDPRLRGVNISNLPTGQAPSGFQSQFQPVPPPPSKPVEKLPEKPPVVVPDPQAEIANLNEQANKEMNDTLALILANTSKVDLSSSTKLTEKLTSLLEDVTTKAPKAPTSLVELFNTKKTELGITPLETDLAGINTKIKQLDADFSSAQQTEEGRLVSTREMSRNLSQTEIAYNRQRRDLLVEKDSIATQLTNKMNTLEMVMNFTQNDFTNASNFYNQEFNKNLQFANLISNLQEHEQTKEERVKTDARANLTMIQNLAKDHKITFTDTQKAQLRALELTAGLPQGFTELISKAAANLEIKGTSSRTDAAGNEYYDVLMVDPKTNAMTVKSIFRGKEEVKPTEGDKAKILSRQMYQALDGKKGSDGYVSPNTWNSLRKGWIAEGGKATDFDENYAQFIDKSHESDYFTSGL